MAQSNNDNSPVIAKSVVAVVAFDKISPFHLSVPCVVFGDHHPGTPDFDLRVCSMDKSPLRTTAGFTINPEFGLDALNTADIIIVPSWRDPAEKPPNTLIAALQSAHERGAMIVGLCVGAYVLAEAGILQNRKATTHWAFADDFSLRYPEVLLDPDVLYVFDGSVVTSAGTAAGIDCCLQLLRQQYGVVCANSLARRLVVPPHRQGGQAQFIEQPLSMLEAEPLTGLIDWVRENLKEPHSLDSLAEKSAMSRRSFTRHFKMLTGTTVGNWLLSERLVLSQRLLETTSHPVERLAALSGFGSAAVLRQHFRKQFGVSPIQWRKTFQGNT